IDEKRIGQPGGITCQLLPMFTRFGELSDIDVRPGETVVTAPAAGLYGGAAVHAALALGVRVMAAGRDTKTLDKLVLVDPKRVAAASFTGDVNGD
ncbi:hypothetical protein B0J12DRAFT_539940, partial [Macrophomina phaseolina]